jgi:hypothetical protein
MMSLRVSRCCAFVLAAAMFCAGPAVAQTPSPLLPPSVLSKTGSFDGISIGQPVSELREKFGDPVRVVTMGSTVVWRYLTLGAATFTDVILKRNLVQSITMLNRFTSVDFTDPNGIEFGLTPDQVRAKLGPPYKTSTNSDDGSLDLTYRTVPYDWVYEFYGQKLGFIQLVVSPASLNNLNAGLPPPIGDGSSRQQAIWIRPSAASTNPDWIDLYLSNLPCGSGGHFKASSQEFVNDAATNDATAITLVHAQCTSGTDRRDYYFDTRGAAAATQPQERIAFTAHDVADLLKATQDAQTSPKITLNLLAKDASEMPAYDPIAHFAGIDASGAGIIWASRTYPKTQDGAWALRSALELACMATGFAGPKWKQIYDQLAAADAALPAGSPNPYQNRLGLTAQVRKIFESYEQQQH